METRDLNPGEIVPEVNPTPAAAESLESENLVDNADAMKVAVEASDAQVNAEAVENAMSQKAFESEKAVEAVEAEEIAAETDAKTVEEEKADEGRDEILEAAEQGRPESELNTKDEVMTRLTELAKDEFVNVSREEIARLKQRFYALRKAEQEAEMAAWIAEEKDVQEFIPALDPTEEAEKLRDEEDVSLAFKRLQNLHDEWRQTGPVAKENREEIWARFKEASTEVNKRYQAFFEERKARELENEKAKTEICERVEAYDFSSLKTYAAWDEMTKLILAAQEEWKKLGFASRKVNNTLFTRFRAVCDKFFTLKAEHYREMKDELAANLAKKTALCEQAEALRESTDWKATAEKLVSLQKEWKTIGTVPKKHSDNIWHRFQEACDTFFERRKANLSESRVAEQANLKEKRTIIEELKAIPLDSPRAETMPKVKELQARWQAVGHVPMRDKNKIYDEYRAACDALYNRLGRDRGNRSRFEDVINEMGSDEQKLYRERERILRAYEIKRNELKTYENNLGFLSSKSKSGDSMVREMERRIQRIKDDLAAIDDKIKLIDSRLAK